MTTGGWINLVLSAGFVSVLFLWCLFRVFRQTPREDKQLAHIEPIDETRTDRR